MQAVLQRFESDTCRVKKRLLTPASTIPDDDSNGTPGYITSEWQPSATIISRSRDENSCGPRRHVEALLDFEQAVFDRRQPAAESALIAFEFGHPLVVAGRAGAKRFRSSVLLSSTRSTMSL